MRPCIERPQSESSQTMPTVTWAPWRPVSTKKLDPNRLVSRLRPSRVNSVNSKIWPPMNVAPNSAVAMIQIRKRRWSPRWIAASASTIVSELISRMNDVTDVNGML